MSKNITTFLLTSFFVFTSISLAKETIPLKDIGGINERKAIEYLQENQIISGYEDGTFQPDKKISRAEFIKILIGSQSTSKECTKTELQNTFSDVPVDSWFAPFVCQAKKQGIIKGYEDGTFRPAQSITFAEATKVISLSHNIDIDLSADGIWFEKYITALKNQKSIRDTLSPEDEITRGEMSEMVWSIITGNEIETGNTLQKITSCTQLNTELQRLEKRNNQHSLFYMRQGGMADDRAIPMMTTSKATLSTSSNESADSSESFTTTNIQETGVDEADIVKNDGTHIVVAQDHAIQIISVEDEEMKQESTINLPQLWIQDLYLDSDRLVVIGRKIYTYPKKEPSSDMIRIMPMPSAQYQQSIALIFDISDRSNPEQIRSVTIDGNITTSRKIDNQLILIANSYLPWDNEEINEETLPHLYDQADKETTLPFPCGDIWYYPNFNERNLVMITKIDIDTPQNPIDRLSILGYSNEVYASSANLYLTRATSSQVWKDNDEDAQWVWEENTKVSKVSFTDTLSIIAETTVPGRILNQFSMSEYQDHFRIATTTGNSWDNSSKNNIYIFDKELNQTGSVEDLAPGESIYAVRFMGDTGYIVTFKKVDPLFVIDLTPNNPTVLGELKIPGYSDYLHPYKDGYLIGIGKDAVASDQGDFAWYQGMKMALFDVRDLENPKELFFLTLGDRGSESEVLHNHKALFNDVSRDVIGFPIQIAKRQNDICTQYTYNTCPSDCRSICVPSTCNEDKTVCSNECSDLPNTCISKNEESASSYGKTIFQGAKWFKIDLEKNEFTPQGSITHFEINAENFWDPLVRIQRLVRINDNIYTISQGIITKAQSQTGAVLSSLSFIENIKCEDLHTQMQCTNRKDCSPILSTPTCPEGQFCIQAMIFEGCEATEKAEE